MWKSKLLISSPKPIRQPQLNDFLHKAYTLDHNENYDEFLQEFEITKNTRIKAFNSTPTIVLSKINEDFVLTTDYPEGRQVRVQFKIGEPIQRLRASGYETRSVFSVADNKLTEEQYIDDKKIVIVREFRKKELLTTMEVNNVKCKRSYSLTSSRYSVGTETSTRSSTWEYEELPESPVSEIQEETVIKNNDIEEDVCY